MTSFVKGTPAHEIAGEIFRLVTELNEALRSAAANEVDTELHIEEVHEVSGAGEYVQLVAIPRKRLTRHSDGPVE
jgi:hypothetical protein